MIMALSVLICGALLSGPLHTGSTQSITVFVCQRRKWSLAAHLCHTAMSIQNPPPPPLPPPLPNLVFLMLGSAGAEKLTPTTRSTHHPVLPRQPEPGIHCAEHKAQEGERKRGRQKEHNDHTNQIYRRKDIIHINTTNLIIFFFHVLSTPLQINNGLTCLRWNVPVSPTAYNTTIHPPAVTSTVHGLDHYHSKLFHLIKLVIFNKAFYASANFLSAESVCKHKGNWTQTATCKATVPSVYSS